MTHATLLELTEAVHGFVPRPAHAGECDACRRTTTLLEGEIELLRRADARLVPARARALRPSLLPFAAAAAVLATIIGIILFRPAPQTAPAQPTTQQGSTKDGPKREPTAEELIKAFVAGNAQAGEKLRARGPQVLAALVEARATEKAAKDPSALSDLIFALKNESTDAAGKLVLEKVDAIRVTVDMSKAPLSGVFDYLREISGLNFVVDADVHADPVDLKLDESLRRILDAMLPTLGLDYGIRYGVVFIGKPDRLWTPSKPEPPPAPLTEEQKRAARAWIAKLASESPEERDQAAGALRKLQSPAIPILEEGTKSKDAETVARCKALIDELTRQKAGASLGTLPAANHWRTQKLAKEDEPIADKLRTAKLDVAFESTRLGDIIGFIRDFNELNIIVEAGADTMMSVKLGDLTLGNLLEVITLPHGLDVKIDKGVITIFESKK